MAVDLTPYEKLGLDDIGGAPSAPTKAAPSPYDAYEKKGLADILSSPAATGADVPAALGPGPDWTWRGAAREIAGGVTRGAGDVINVLSDPYANLVGRPVLTAWQAAHDFLAPMIGGRRYTEEERNALYADFANQPGERFIKTVGQNVPGGPPIDPYNLEGGTSAEKFLGTAAEGGAAATIAAPLFGGAGIVKGLPGWSGAPAGAPLWAPSTSAVSALTAAPLAGAAGAVAGDVAAKNVAPWLQPFASLVGNVAGAKVANVASTIGTKAVGAATGATTPVAAAYDELGIDKTLLGDVSGGETARQVQAYASKAPFSASTVRPVEQRVVGQFNGAVEDTASRLGTSASEQTAGEALQREARNWRDTVFPQRQAQAWAPVDRLLGGEAVAPSNYRAALTSLTDKLSALPDTAKVLIPQRTWDLLDAINKDVPAGQTMSWQQAQSLRTVIGKVMGVPEIVQSVGKDQLTRAYGGISQDMKDTAAAVDTRNSGMAASAGVPAPPSAVDAFNNANKVSTDGHAFIDGPLSKIIKTTNPAQDIDPEKATRSVLGSTDTTLEAIKRELPTAANEVAAYKLRDMALATPGAAGRTGQETSVGTFLTDLNRMRQQNPGGFAALYSDPVVARKIDALATVADTMKDTARRANTSGTGPYLALAEPAGAALATWMATQDPTYTALAVGGPFALNKAAGYGVTSPTLSRIGGAPGPRNLPNPLLTGALLGQINRQNALKQP